MQLEPFEDDKADARETLHTAHLLNVLTSEEFEIDDEVIESITPKYWREAEAEPESPVEHAQSLQQLILTNFA